MAQALLFAGMFVFGAALTFAFGPRRDALLCSALAFPVGLAGSVFVGLALLVTGVPVTPVSFAVVGGLAFAGVGLVAVRRGALEPRALIVAAVWLVALVVVTWWLSDAVPPKCHTRAVACIVNRRAWKHQENALQLLEKFGATSGLLFETQWSRLHTTPLFSAVLRGEVGVLGAVAVNALSIVLRLSLIALVGVVSWRAVERRPWWMRAIVIVAAGLTTRWVLKLAYKRFFVDLFLMQAVYLFGFVALWSLAERRRDAAGLPLALLCLAAFALSAPELAPVAALVLAIAATMSRLPRTTPIATFTAGMLLWLSYPASEDRWPDDDRLAMLAFAGTFALVLLAQARPLRRFAPVIALVLALAGVAWLVDTWRGSPDEVRQALFVIATPIALTGVALLLGGRGDRVPAEDTSPRFDRRRATALAFTAVISMLLVSNVRLILRNQRRAQERFRLMPHNGFNFLGASDGSPDPRSETPP